MRLLALMCFCAPLALAAPTSAEPPPVRWSARLEPSDARAAEGARVVVTARIAAGWHLYSTTQPPGGSLRTRIVLLPSAGLGARGKVVQPPFTRKNNPAFKITDELHQGAVSFGLPVVLGPMRGNRRGVVEARFQLCSERLCSPPKTVRIPFSWTPRPGKARAGRKSALASLPTQPKSARPSGNYLRPPGINLLEEAQTMKNNTHQKRWIARAAALALLCGAGAVGAAHLTMPTAEAQISGARSAPLPPELVGKSWLNTPGGKPISLASRRGEVTIVQFWTFGCSNCRANLPAYERLQKQFASRGVQIIGVHTPETDGERDPENVARRVKELNITHPVLLDAQGENWKRWGQRYWPTVYVLDRAGRVRFKWEGELNYNGAGGEKKAAALIENLLREPKPAAAN